MARTDQQFPLRLPPELKEKLENACKESGRSKNAEAVYRLEKSFEEREDYQIYFHLMMEVHKDQQQKIDELHKMVQLLTDKKAT
ncbi:Arc family DNA-binding protein [Acinetobacter pollinis]|uniref:Arc family DNA-binding protein n=1 Tax=Acinetobacter pollinis TaxID=2605270 RepID=UPI0018C2C4FB|nr:Arc family DNA-binding protein [Acinetobacter pollinis]MBF7693472.1 Arc family DNA-binding protein [Acinetobacter pollinis]MBF7700984.1 Arc family DNA-binding protein [Acinetobacter pollinis]